MPNSVKPSQALLVETMQLLPNIEKRITEAELEIIANSLDTVLFRDMTVRQYLPYMEKVARASRYDLLDLIRKLSPKDPE